MDRERGVTLVELLVGISVFAIISFWVVPSYSQIIAENRLTSDAYLLVKALHLARSEAVKRGTRVTLCKSANGRDCAAEGGYAQGWIVFEDPAKTASVDGDEEILRVFNITHPDDVVIEGNRLVSRYVSYTALGVPRSRSGAFQAGTLTLCRGAGGRRVTISRAGRVTAQRTDC